MVNFVVMTRGRTGSTAVIDELQRAEGLFVGGEIFIKAHYTRQELVEIFPFIPQFDSWKQEKLINRILPDSFLARKYLHKFKTYSKKNHYNAFGFKLLSHFLSERPFLHSLLIENNYKIIYLQRNPAPQVLSGMIAQLRNIYNSKTELDDTQIYEIDLKKLKHLIEIEIFQVAKDLDFLVESKIPFLKVTYENFLADRKNFYSEIYDFLQIPNKLPPHSNYKKMIKSHEEKIKNIKEVENLLSEMKLPSLLTTSPKKT